MQSELKPCPFCGGDEQSFGLEVRWPNDIGHVECHGCNALITGETEAEAIAAWNTRASDAEITRLTEALRAAEEREEVLREEREELLSQISDCRGSHWLGRQDRKGVTPHLDAIWRGLVEIDDARAALKEQPHADA